MGGLVLLAFVSGLGGYYFFHEGLDHLRRSQGIAEFISQVIGGLVGGETDAGCGDMTTSSLQDLFYPIRI